MSIPNFRMIAEMLRFPRGGGSRRGPRRGRGSALRRRARGCLLLVMAAAAVAGCSPSLDWRTLHSEAGYTIDLPARPTVDARTVEIGGAPLTMRMQAAHVGGAVFAVGTVMLPEASEAGRRVVLDALRAALSRNLRAQPAVREVTVPLAAGGSTPGVELTIRGEPAGASGAAAGKTVVARLVARGAHVYQAVAIADAPLPAEALDQFFGSLKLD
ncbi:hypothetical protein GIY62_08910 [Burkholderia plantarii]|uniref:hypothetical protein n=1 Tax=Burkholderia plantarii TaxID=41899 RepID=UPI00272DBCBE|nr:hypothetical protein [Burkholderia plantarii]WLE60743.1 hypothetical protein GIY62_08910 [Burkholderia plantarii]